MDQPTNYLCLYILMRTDLASMNPGKAVAQGAHAANQMTFAGLASEDADLVAKVKEYQTLADGFGTCICLGVTESEMRETVGVAKDLGLHCGITHDPSYPLVDGKVLHLLPLDTCGWVFGGKLDCAPAVYDLKLMP